MKIDLKMDRGFYITGWILILVTIAYRTIAVTTGIHLLAYNPPCAFHLLTGFYCPGCGGTRAAIAFSSGQIVRSFLLHPFVPYVLILGGWFMISQTIQRISRGKCKIAMHFRMIYLWVGLVIILLNWIWKNAWLVITGVTILS